MKPDKTETARERRRRTSKFANRDPNWRKGDFGIRVLYHSHDTMQGVPSDNFSKALSHWSALKQKPNVIYAEIVEYIPVFDKDGNPTNHKRANVLLSFRNTNQQFVNSREERIWRKPGSTVEMTDKAAFQQGFRPHQLELVRVNYVDGSPWWERRV